PKGAGLAPGYFCSPWDPKSPNVLAPGLDTCIATAWRHFSCATTQAGIRTASDQAPDRTGSFAPRPARCLCSGQAATDPGRSMDGGDPRVRPRVGAQPRERRGTLEHQACAESERGDLRTCPC